MKRKVMDTLWHWRYASFLSTSQTNLQFVVLSYTFIMNIAVDYHSCCLLYTEFQNVSGWKGSQAPE